MNLNGLRHFFNSTVESESLKVANIGAALVVPVIVGNNSLGAKADETISSSGGDNQRYFVLTFGYGRTLINRSAIEERFGLKCVLNSVKNDTLRAIHRRASRFLSAKSVVVPHRG